VKRLRSNCCVGLTVEIGRRKDVMSGLIQLRFIYFVLPLSVALFLPFVNLMAVMNFGEYRKTTINL